MAIINGTSVGGMTLQADYSYTQNTTANTSSVTVILKLANHYALYSSALSGSYISVGGSKTNYSKSISYGGSTTTTTELTRKTVTVTHNNDGTATCNISGTFVMNGTYRGSSVGTMSVSQTITLPKIARSSSFTISSSVNTGSALSGTVTPSSTAFNHKIQLKIGSTVKDTISLAVGTKTFSYTVPHTWFPSSTSGTVTAVLQTYNGTTLVATTSKNVTANVPASVVPSVSAFTAAIAANGLSGLYVQGKTTAKLTATAASSGGATIKSYTYSGPNVTASANSTTVTANTITTAAIKSSGTLTYTVKVQDSRGRTASRNVTISVQAYSTPTIGPVAVQRCDANGNISQSGTYARYTVNSSYASVGGKNTRTVTVAYSSNNGTSYSGETTLQAATDTASTKTGTYGGGAFALASTYILRFTIKDAYGATKTVTAPLQSAARPINIKSNGKGIGIGKMAETDNLLDVSWNERVRGNLSVDGNTAISGTLIANGKTTLGGDLQVNNNSFIKGHLYMGGNKESTSERSIRFTTPDNSTYPHNTYIFGGNAEGPAGIGIYDAKNSRVVFSYNDVNNSMTIGNATTININGGALKDFVVEQGASGGWTWKKWFSGRMEVYGTASHNPTAVNDGINSMTVTMPVSFVDTNFKVLLTPAKCGLLVTRFGDCASNNDITHTKNTFVLSYRYNHGTVYTVNFNVMAFGAWK